MPIYPIKRGIGMGKGKGLAKRSTRAQAPLTAISPVPRPMPPVDSSLRRLHRPLR